MCLVQSPVHWIEGWFSIGGRWSFATVSVTPLWYGRKRVPLAYQRNSWFLIWQVHKRRQEGAVNIQVRNRIQVKWDFGPIDTIDTVKRRRDREGIWNERCQQHNIYRAFVASIHLLLQPLPFEKEPSCEDDYPSNKNILISLEIIRGKSTLKNLVFYRKNTVRIFG